MDRPYLCLVRPPQQTAHEEFAHLSDTELDVAFEQAQDDYGIMLAVFIETSRAFAEALSRRNRILNVQSIREQEKNRG